MKIRRITSGVAILALISGAAGCSSDDDGTPAPTATSRPATSTVPPQNTATRTPTNAPSPTQTGTAVRTPTTEVEATATPTRGDATFTPTGTAEPTEIPTDLPTPTSTVTPESPEPTPTETPVAEGLGVRQFTVVRLPVFELGDPTSSFNTSAIGGFDVSQDPWLPSTFKLLAGQPGENGIAPLTLVEDVIVGFPVIDGSIACFKFVASGSTGEVACQAGLGRAVKLSQDSNGNQPPEPPVLTATVDPESVAGSIYLSLDSGFANLALGASPGDCAAAAFMGVGPTLFSSWSGEAEVVDSRPSGDTISISANGRPFDCDDWTNPTGPGMIVNPVIGFDQSGLSGGDVANLLVIYGEGTTP